MTTKTLERIRRRKTGGMEETPIAHVLLRAREVKREEKRGENGREKEEKQRETDFTKRPRPFFRPPTFTQPHPLSIHETDN